MFELFLTIVVSAGFFGYLHRDKVRKGYQMVTSGYQAYQTISTLSGGLDPQLMTKILQVIATHRSTDSVGTGTGTESDGTGRPIECGDGYLIKIKSSLDGESGTLIVPKLDPELQVRTLNASIVGIFESTMIDLTPPMKVGFPQNYTPNFLGLDRIEVTSGNGVTTTYYSDQSVTWPPEDEQEFDFDS